MTPTPHRQGAVDGKRAGSPQSNTLAFDLAKFVECAGLRRFLRGTARHLKTATRE